MPAKHFTAFMEEQLGTGALVGTKTNDMLGLPAKVPFNSSRGVIALSNGNYVIASPRWDNGNAVDVGAVTFGDGTTGTSGESPEPAV